MILDQKSGKSAGAEAERGGIAYSAVVPAPC